MKKTIQLLEIVYNDDIKSFDLKTYPHVFWNFLEKEHPEIELNRQFAVLNVNVDKFKKIDAIIPREANFSPSDNKLRTRDGEIVELNDVMKIELSDVCIEYKDDYFFKTPNSTVIGFKVQDSEYVKMFNIHNGTLSISSENIDLLNEFITKYESNDENEILFYREMRNFTF